MLIRIIEDTFISGDPISASDDPVEMDEGTALILISSCKAERYQKAKVEEAPVKKKK